VDKLFYKSKSVAYENQFTSAVVHGLCLKTSDLADIIQFLSK
jgi:hypothetical protein